MAEITGVVTESVERFLAAVRMHRRIEAAYLYGSQIRGTASEWSDIDVAVISADSSSDLFEEWLMLMRLAVQVDDRIEPHPFRPQDFHNNAPLASEIQRTGVRLV